MTHKEEFEQSIRTLEVICNILYKMIIESKDEIKLLKGKADKATQDDDYIMLDDMAQDKIKELMVRLMTKALIRG